MQDGKADEYKKSLGSEIYLLNQDYGLRSGCLWNYKHKEESVVLYPRPFGVDEETYNEYSDAYTLKSRRKLNLQFQNRVFTRVHGISSTILWLRRVSFITLPKNAVNP